MHWIRKLLRIAAAVVVAIASAHTVESLKAPAVHKSILVEAAAIEEAHPDNVLPPVATTVPDSASLATDTAVGIDDVIGITPVAASSELASEDHCQPELELAPLPGAMIHASLFSPCNRNERIVIRHSGLAFSAQTQPDGHTTVVLPAMKSDAMVAVYFKDSRLVLGKVSIPDVSAYARLAIVWNAPVELEMRVTNGDKVLIGSPALLASPVQQIMTLGTAKTSDPVLAQVYSLPGSQLGQSEIIGELRITQATCGRTVRFHTVYSIGGMSGLADRSVAVPLCGTAGNILVLKNLAPALKLAAPK